jgi:hypothetical protein
LGINPTETTSNRAEITNVIGKKSFKIFIGFKPKDVITVSSYSLDNFARVITNDKKNEIGIVKNKICGTTYINSVNNSKKLIVIIDVKDAILTKKITDVIKNNPKNIGKNVIAN